MASKDYYNTLGVSRDADEEAIRKAYKQLARKYHPDVNPGNKQAEERFKEIAEAYAVLGDKRKRQEYDVRGPEGFSPGVDPSEIFRRARAGGVDPFDLSSLFGDLFGGGGGRRTSWVRQGADAEAGLTIEFRDSVDGVTLPLQVKRGGSGGVSRTEAITVRIPAGVSDGTRLRITGKGEAGMGGGPPGDLYVRIQVRPHPFFRREGDAIVCRVPLTLAEAALGGKVIVPTPDGETTMTIPAGTHSGQRFRLKGKGIRKRRGRGPLYVDIRIVPPKKLDAKSRDLLEEFARLNPQDDLRADLAKS
jgi:DnaJ-class molecular chaperone